MELRARPSPGPDGKRRQRLKGGFPTKAEAQKALTAVLADVQRGVVVESSNVTLAQFLEDWLTSVSRSLKPTTWEGYAHAVRVWIVPRIGSYRLNAITPEVLERLYASLETGGRQDGTGGLGPRAVRLAHQVLHRALAQAVTWRRLAINPADAGLHLPRQVRKPFKTWSEAEARRFLEVAVGDRRAALGADAVHRHARGRDPRPAMGGRRPGRWPAFGGAARGGGEEPPGHPGDQDPGEPPFRRPLPRRRGPPSAGTPHARSRTASSPGPLGRRPAWCSRPPSAPCSIPERKAEL